MHKIYVAGIEPLMEDDFYQEALSKIGKDRREKAEKMVQRTDKARSVAAGLLLRYAVEDCITGEYAGEFKQCSVKPDAGFFRDGNCYLKEYGKPMLSEESGLYFNLSHSGDYVLCAVADTETGSDIQKHERYADRLAERFFHPEEMAYLKEAKDRKQCFYDLWCLKESCVKCTGRGLSTGMEKFSVVPFFHGEEITLDGVRCVGKVAPDYIKTELKGFTKVCRTEMIEGYSMAVALQKPVHSDK